MFLEFNKVTEEIKKCALSEKALEMVDNLQPSTDIDIIHDRMNETTEAMAMLKVDASIPLILMTGMQLNILKAQKNMILTSEELSACQNLLELYTACENYKVKAVAVYNLIVNHLLAEEKEAVIQNKESIAARSLEGRQFKKLLHAGVVNFDKMQLSVKRQELVL